MKRTIAACVALLAAALAFGVASASADNVRFGVNDDEGMFEKGTGPFFSTLTSLGMYDNTITVRWDESTPSGFEDLGGGVTLQSFLPAAVAAANLAGVRLTFDVYPRHSLAAGNPSANAPRFAAWLKTLASTYPSVTHYVVMNECNQPLFVNPQYDARGNLLSAADCGQFLAAGYQALKSVNPGIFVWGLGLSPHGAHVDGTVHRDSSPFDFLAALGAWYKASPYAGARIMDGLDLHPYPIPQSVPFAQGNGTGNGPAYGVATLPLVYQAFYDAFNRTAQPTVGPGRLPVSLNEVGIQTVPTVGGYTGSETPNWGIDGTTGTQDYQAQWYKQLIDTVECDASITNVNIFKLLDQSDLSGWQSGLYQLGWVAKTSAAVVKNEIATVKSCPTGAASYWSPAGGTGGSTSTGSGPSSTGGSVSGDLTAFSGGSTGSVMSALSNIATAGSLGGGASAIFQALGVPTQSGSGTESLVAGDGRSSTRRLASAKLPSRRFSFTKGTGITAPSLGTVRVGAYRLKIVLRPAGAKPVTLLSAPFTIDKHGKLSAVGPAKKAKAKAKAKPKRKPKPKKKKKH